MFNLGKWINPAAQSVFIEQYCDCTASIGSKMIAPDYIMFQWSELPRVHYFVDNLVGYTNLFRFSKRTKYFFMFSFVDIFILLQISANLLSRENVTNRKLIFGWTYYKLTVVHPTFCGGQQLFNFLEKKKRTKLRVIFSVIKNTFINFKV